MNSDKLRKELSTIGSDVAGRAKYGSVQWSRSITIGTLLFIARVLIEILSRLERADND